MKVKLALLDQDRNYLERLTANLQIKYGDKLELYAFTDISVAMGVLVEKSIDVFMASPYCQIPFDRIPSRCGFAYLVETSDIEEVYGRRAVCKYQKVDSFYKQIIGVFSDYREDISFSSNGEGSGRLVVFSSPCGGVGTSSMAAAYAISQARNGKRPIYLNVEKFGTAEVFFDGEGSGSFSDVLYALKSKKGNLSLKIESCLKEDKSGVRFLASPRAALDMVTLSLEDLTDLVFQMRSCIDYDMLIIDMDFSLDEATMKLLRQANSIVWVSDGSASANAKVQRAYEALKMLESDSGLYVGDSVRLVYNRFSNKTGKRLTETDLQNIGGIRRFEHATTPQVVAELSRQEFLDRI